MKKWMFALSVACSMTFVLSIAAADGQPTSTPPRSDSGSTTATCAAPLDTYRVTISPTSLWPPNHVQVPVTITVHEVSDPNRERVCVQINSISGSQGGSNSGPAGRVCGAVGTSAGNSVSQTVFLEATRAGDIADGQTYTISVTSSESETPTGPTGLDPCTRTVTVNIPHDQGQ
jgi:hypothetical protein